MHFFLQVVVLSILLIIAAIKKGRGVDGMCFQGMQTPVVEENTSFRRTRNYERQTIRHIGKELGIGDT